MCHTMQGIIIGDMDRYVPLATRTASVRTLPQVERFWWRHRATRGNNRVFFI